MTKITDTDGEDVVFVDDAGHSRATQYDLAGHVNMFDPAVSETEQRQNSVAARIRQRLLTRLRTNADWDPDLHPRDSKGRFMESLIDTLLGADEVMARPGRDWGFYEHEVQKGRSRDDFPTVIYDDERWVLNETESDRSGESGFFRAYRESAQAERPSADTTIIRYQKDENPEDVFQAEVMQRGTASWQGREYVTKNDLREKAENPAGETVTDLDGNPIPAFRAMRTEWDPADIGVMPTDTVVSVEHGGNTYRDAIHSWRDRDQFPEAPQSKLKTFEAYPGSQLAVWEPGLAPDESGHISVDDVDQFVTKEYEIDGLDANVQWSSWKEQERKQVGKVLSEHRGRLDKLGIVSARPSQFNYFDGESGRPYGQHRAHGTGQSDIYVKTRRFSNRWPDDVVSEAGERGWLTQDSVEDLTAHELAHHLHYLKIQQSWSSVPEFDEVLGQWPSLELSEIGEQVSRYAMENPLEFVAEMYAKLRRGEDPGARFTQLYDALDGPAVTPKAGVDPADVPVRTVDADGNEI